MSDSLDVSRAMQAIDLVPRNIDRVDMHAHFLPQCYLSALRQAGLERPDGMPGLPDWSVDVALATMDQLGVRMALLSIPSPGVHFGDPGPARVLARQVNEAAHALQQAHPGRFGQFAALPLPDVQAAIREAIHALETLGAAGVLLSSNHQGMYMGDPRLDPLYSELNQRGSLVFVHPTSPACSCCPRLADRYPQPMLEFMFETTRSVTDMILAGVLQRFPRLRLIVPHAGALIPTLASRIALSAAVLRDAAGSPPPSLSEALRHLYFDLAGSPVPHQLRALLEVADPQRILYGSDYPFTPRQVCDSLLRQLERTPLLEAPLQEMVLRDNAITLLSTTDAWRVGTA